MITRYLTFLLPLLLVACSKKGEPVEQIKYTNLELKAITADPLTLKVVVDEDLVLAESFQAPGVSSEIPLEYNGAKHHFQVYNIFGNALLLDTMITYKPGRVNSITFFQSSPGSNLLWIGPPENESLPASGYLKLSIVYNYALLPDSVRVVVENSIDGGQAYAPSDSFTLKRNEFSRYFTGRSNTRKPDVKFYTTTAPRKLLAEALKVHYTANPDFSIYLLNVNSSSVPYTLNPTKLY